MTARWRSCAIVCLLVMGGCATGDPEAATLGQRHQEYTRPMNQVGLLDRSLDDMLVVESISSHRSPTDRVVVTMELRNRAAEPTTVLVRTHFYDAGDRVVESTRWSRVFLPQRGIEHYEALSTRIDALRYYVEVRRAQ